MRRPEQALQIQTVAFMNAIPDLLFFHVPNGGGRSKVEGAILKAMGVKPGVPDLVIIRPNLPPAFIELKAGNGKATATQLDFAKQANARGCPWVECRSLADVAEVLDVWLTPLGFRIPKVIA